jgi:hypothetical protein
MPQQSVFDRMPSGQSEAAARMRTEAATIRSALYSRLKGFLAVFTVACYGSVSHIRNLSFLCWSGLGQCFRTVPACLHFNTK